MKRGLKITFLPFVFLAVRVESRFSRNVVLVDMYLLCRLKIGALAAILWNTQWIDDADGRVLGGIAKGG